MRQDILHGVTTAEDIGTINRYLCGDPMQAMVDLRAEVLKLTGAPDCVLVTNCNQALRLAMLMFAEHGYISSRTGDDCAIIVPDATYVATAHAVLSVGQPLTLVDIDRETLHMSVPGSAGWPDSAAAVVPVELLGRPISSALVAALKDFGAPIIVDAAQSLGATRWRDEYAAMCVSFAANKIVHGHQGGAILCRTEDADRIRLYIRHGRAPDVIAYHHVSMGENLCMNPLGAAHAVSQCRRINDIIDNRSDQKDSYRAAGVLWGSGFSNMWLHVGPRQANIGKPCCDLWEPLHMLPHLKQDGEFPNSEWAYDYLVALPSSDDLTPEQIEETYR